MSDLISRQAVLDALDLLDEDWRNVMAYKVEKIPSAERKGKWISGDEMPEYPRIPYKPWKMYCSECKTMNDASLYNFCPNCGADMRGEEDEQTKD